MKKNIKISIAIILMLAFIMQSCTTTKRDCRGKTKHRLSNGIYM